MKRPHHEIKALWLDSRNPSLRTGAEGEKFADECWTEGKRLSAIQAIHYQLIMDVIRKTLTG